MVFVYQMNGILFIGLRLAACDFHRIKWFEILSSYVIIEHLALEKRTLSQ